MEELHEFYERCGLQSEGLPEDFLGTMLECAAWLLEQGTKQGQELLTELWDKHLIAWLPEFGAKLTEQSRLALYRDMGNSFPAYPMKQPEWQLAPPELMEDEALEQAVIDVHEAIYRDYFLDELLVNHQLPIELRALRRADGWRLLLLLTPWMLVRLYLPDEQPEIPIADGWSAEQRMDATLTVIGPAVSFQLLGPTQKAHLNFHSRLGHYLMQPLIQSMEQFESAAAAYSAWNEVIKIRDENVKKLNRRCDWQEEVSRREFFKGFRRT